MRAGRPSSRPSPGSLKRGCGVPGCAPEVCGEGPSSAWGARVPLSKFVSRIFTSAICQNAHGLGAEGRGPGRGTRRGQLLGPGSSLWPMPLPPPSPHPPCSLLRSPFSCSEPPVITPASGDGRAAGARVGACLLRGVGRPALPHRKLGQAVPHPASSAHHAHPAHHAAATPQAGLKKNPNHPLIKCPRLTGSGADLAGKRCCSRMERRRPLRSIPRAQQETAQGHSCHSVLS